MSHFATKLVNYSRHIESLKYVWKSRICCYRKKTSECLKTHYAANNWPIWTQRGNKRSVKMWTLNIYKIFFKIFCCTLTVGCQWYFGSHEFGPRKWKWMVVNVYWTARLFWRDALFAFSWALWNCIFMVEPLARPL